MPALSRPTINSALKGNLTYDTATISQKHSCAQHTHILHAQIHITHNIPSGTSNVRRVQHSCTPTTTTTITSIIITTASKNFSLKFQSSAVSWTPNLRTWCLCGVRMCVCVEVFVCVEVCCMCVFVGGVCVCLCGVCLCACGALCVVRCVFLLIQLCYSPFTANPSSPASSITLPLTSTTSSPPHTS